MTARDATPAQPGRAAVTTLTQVLHDTMCMSRDWCTGGDHLRRFRKPARAILGAPDPVAALHGQVCPAAIGQEVYPAHPTYAAGCQQPEEHGRRIAEKLMPELVSAG